MATYRSSFETDDRALLERFTAALREVLPIPERETIAPTATAVYAIFELDTDAAAENATTSVKLRTCSHADLPAEAIHSAWVRIG